MMLATALQIHLHSRNWRRNHSNGVPAFQQVVRLFGDSDDHPFSLQSLLKLGKKDLGKKYGEWYGPSSVAYVLKYCVDKAKREGVREVKNFVIYAATDCMLFRDDIIHMAGGSHGTQNPGIPTSWQSILVLVSVRLGADELNMSYHSAIQTFLASPICIGIMGGRKRHSLYFCGFQGKKLIHYDPHHCQQVVKVQSDFSIESYVCMKPRKMSFSKMDPSCTFGFYLRDRSDLDKLIELSNKTGGQKVFEILDGTKDEYMSLINAPTIQAFMHNESMMEEGPIDISSLEGSDFEYLE